MRRRSRTLRTILFLVALVVALILSSCFPSRPEVPAGEVDEETVIAVISKGFEHQFWQTVKLGAIAAAEAHHIAITFEGPATESMVDVQTDLIENAITRRADGILLAALDAARMVPYVRRAQEQGIPVATFDSGVETAVLTHVGTNNLAGGREAARRLAALIDGSGTVGLIVHDGESESGRERRDGFMEEMAESYPEISVLPPVYGAGNRELSAELVASLLAEHPQVDGLFGANEGSAVGAARALVETGRALDVRLVGFDASDEQVRYLREGIIDGLLVQDPFAMGYSGVELLQRHLEGSPVPPLRETPVTYVTVVNLENPEVERLLTPAAAEE